MIALLLAPSTAGAIQIPSFTSVATKQDGSVETRAGAHPYQLVTDISFGTTVDGMGNIAPEQNLKDLRVDLPAGLIGDPSVAPECTAKQLADFVCPYESQVGVVSVAQALGGAVTGTLYLPIYRVVPHRGVPAEFGFNALQFVVRSRTFVRTGGDYGLSFDLTEIPQPTAIVSTTFTLWGVPADPSHDAERGAVCLQRSPFPKFCFVPGNHPSKLLARPFLTLPSDCSAGPMATKVSADSWQSPGSWATASHQSQLPDGTPVGVDNCDKLRFDASMKARAAQKQAAAPSPYVMDLDVPQNDNPTGLGTPPLKKAVVTLPEGTAVNPSSAQGLDGCSPVQIALDSAADDTCPDSSRIGDVTLTTPLLADPMKGAIYLAKPHDNPSNSLMALYLSIKGSGVLVKLPGKIDLDSKTGQLTATFDDNPQLPFSNLHLEFRGGDRAPLVNPSTCGTKTTTAELTAWSGQVTTSTSTFDISGDGQGGPCPAHQFAPKLEAGATNPVAGANSPFSFRLTRSDVDSEFSSVHTTLPDGMLANVKDVALCGDAAAAAGTCGNDSLIGHVEVASGAGGSPFFLQGGRVYFTGPYRGAPFGLSIVVPVLAGPFDLGTVVVRAAVSVDPNTAAVTVDTDPLPTMLQGIPLKIRDLRLTIDRSGFMINPTSCDARTLNATIGSTAGDHVTVGNRFQVGDCASLPLAPKLTMALTGNGETKSGKHPTLVAHMSQQPGEAHLRKAVVKLPTALGFDIKNDKSVCKLADAKAGKCAASSMIGHASVLSVLHGPLTGPVYLTENASARGGLPGLFIPLKAEGVTLNLMAATTIVGSRLITTFDNIPDAPIRSFDLRIDGGNGGILVLGRDLCKATPTTALEADGQNGKLADGTIVVRTPCTLRKLSHKVGRTSVTVRLGGLGAGKVTLSGPGIRTASRTLSNATVASISAGLTASSRRQMREHRLRKLRVQVTFTPVGGKAVTRHYTLLVR